MTRFRASMMLTHWRLMKIRIWTKIVPTINNSIHIWTSVSVSGYCKFDRVEASSASRPLHCSDLQTDHCKTFQFALELAGALPVQNTGVRSFNSVKFPITTDTDGCPYVTIIVAASFVQNLFFMSFKWVIIKIALYVVISDLNYSLASAVNRRVIK